MTFDKKIQILEALRNKNMSEDKLDLSTMLYMRHAGLEFPFDVPFCNSINHYDEKEMERVRGLGGLVNVFAVDHPDWVQKLLDRIGIKYGDIYCLVFDVDQVEPLLHKMPIWTGTVIGIDCRGVVDSKLQETLDFLRKRTTNPVLVYGVASDHQVSTVWSWGADYVFRGIEDQSNYLLEPIQNFENSGYCLDDTTSLAEMVNAFANGSDMVMLGKLPVLDASMHLAHLMQILGIHKFKDLKRDVELLDT